MSTLPSNTNATERAQYIEGEVLTGDAASAKKVKLSEYSPITYAVLKLFHALKWFSVMQWLSLVNPIFRSRSKLTTDEIHCNEFIIKRTRAIEMYLLTWMLVETLLVIFLCSHLWPQSWPWSTAFQVTGITIAAVRIVEIMQVSVNTAIFDALNGQSENIMASSARMVVLAGINFIELITCFGIIYATDCADLFKDVQPIGAFYFSGITQLTIGYGDISPLGWLRFIALIQGLAGTLFLILIFGRFVSALRPMKIAFEDQT